MMTAPAWSDPLLFLPAHGSTQGLPVEHDSQAAPQYTTKHAQAPPYYPPSPLPPTGASNSNALPSSSPLSRSLSPPPDYNASDPLTREFHLRGHFIYATSTGTPQYQLNATLTSTGRPHQLRLRRLLPNEMRRAHRKPASPQTSSSLTPNSLTRSTTAPAIAASPPALTPLTPTRSTPAASPHGSAAEEPFLPYDDDLTLYAATLYPTGALELRGHRASSLPGSVVVSPTPSFSSSSFSSTTFWHCTRNRAFDALDPVHEARIQKYGYRAKDEWKREVLFAAKGGGFLRAWKGRGRGREVEWVDRVGKRVAVERERVLRLERVVEKRVRDVLVMCWAVRNWRAVLEG